MKLDGVLWVVTAITIWLIAGAVASRVGWIAVLPLSLVAFITTLRGPIKSMSLPGALACLLILPGSLSPLNLGGVTFNWSVGDVLVFVVCIAAFLRTGLCVIKQRASISLTQLDVAVVLHHCI